MTADLVFDKTAFMKKHRRHAFAVVSSLAILAAAGPAFAQDRADSSDEFEELEEIMVVVGRTTNVDLDAGDIAKLQASDLNDLFRDTPSISVGGMVGIAQKIYIRGVEDTLLNVTVDGAPQTGTLFHHIGRVSIEPELLRQVSVQAGAGEATSGFGAIGGSVRFETKTANDLLEDGDSFGGLAKASYFSNDAYKLSLTGYGKISDNWGVLGSYVWVDRSTVKDGAGNLAPGTAAEQALAFVKVSGELSDEQLLTLSYEQRDEKGALCQRPNWRCSQADPLYPIDAKRQTAVFNYSNNLNDFFNLELSAYYTKADIVQNVEGRWGRYGADMETYGFDLRNVSDVGEHELIYGVEYRHDTVSSEYLDGQDIIDFWAWDPAVGYFEERGKLLGIYFQDHFSVSENLVLSFGARYDSYKLDMITYSEDADSNDFSFNAGFNYDITSEISFTAGYAQAARGKEVSDAFTLESRPGRIRMDPNLTSENAENFEVAVVYENEGLHASVSYYNSKISDVLFDQIGGRGFPEDNTYFENIGDYNAEGWEFKFAYTAEKWYFNSFFTSYTSDLNGNPVEAYETNGLANAAGDRLVANFAYTPSEALEIGWRITHTWDLDDIEVLHRGVEIGWIDELQTIDKPGYTVNDLYIQWLPTGSENLKVNLSANNIFDVLYRSHASVGDYSHIPDWEIVVGNYDAGRDVRITVSLGF